PLFLRGIPTQNFFQQFPSSLIGIGLDSRQPIPEEFSFWDSRDLACRFEGAYTPNGERQLLSREARAQAIRRDLALLVMYFRVWIGLKVLLTPERLGLFDGALFVIREI